MRRAITIVMMLALIPTALETQGAKPKAASPYFVYDAADKAIDATMLHTGEYYDASVASTDDGVWAAWLKFTPGKGDEIHVGRRSADGWAVEKTVTDATGRYACPTLTVDTAGKLAWLSYETLNAADGGWDVMVRPHAGGGKFGPPVRISPGKGNDISHRVRPGPDGGLWVVWQADRGGQFDILARRVSAKGTLAAVEDVTTGSGSEWSPALAVWPDGALRVAWDVYDGQSYNVISRRRGADGVWGRATTAAAGPAFQGRAQLAPAAGTNGGAWILWESGAENWGKPHRGMAHKNPKLSDSYGPLHRFREIHVGMITREGTTNPLTIPLPMPSFAQAAKRTSRRPDTTRMGVFYERGLLTIDRAGRPWVVYRHYYTPQASVAKGMRSHVEAGWKIFARCMEGKGWSPLHAFSIGQRDGMQRLSVAPTADGLAAVWTTGRTDRRKDPKPRGVAIGLLAHPKGKPPAHTITLARATTRAAETPARTAKPATVGGKTYRLFYGDLHRHTDLSLCFPFFDGTLDDAYRYAIDVAGLDFLGITDHTRDINNGNVKSQLWWRCTKEVTRHRLTDRFFPMFTYERSNGTDHNVITLRDDVLRNFTYPLTQFWKELDRDSFTVPHAPVNAKTWAYQDDALRPLIEIYQGCRDYDSQKQAHVGLDKGYHLGFIASSDHVSTSASYACVWAPKVGLEPIFRSMQARRTYGATAKIRLVFRSGDHWMGEKFIADAVPTFQIEIEGTAALKQLTLYDNGRKVGELPFDQGSASVNTTYRPGKYFTGKHYLYIHMVQTDGNQAWSSLIWVIYANPVKDPTL